MGYAHRISLPDKDEEESKKLREWRRNRGRERERGESKRALKLKDDS